MHRIISCEQVLRFAWGEKQSVVHWLDLSTSDRGTYFRDVSIFFGYPLPVVVIIREQRMQGCRILEGLPSQEHGTRSRGVIVLLSTN